MLALLLVLFEHQGAFAFAVAGAMELGVQLGELHVDLEKVRRLALDLLPIRQRVVQAPSGLVQQSHLKTNFGGRGAQLVRFFQIRSSFRGAAVVAVSYTHLVYGTT